MQNSKFINYKHLKENSYYSDPYDRLTIEECQRWENKEYPKPLKETGKSLIF